MALAGLHLSKCCVRCGVVYQQSRSDQQFCSVKCNQGKWHEIFRARRRARRDATPRIECGICRKKFLTGQRRRYCSQVCHSRADFIRLMLRFRNGPGKHWAKGKERVSRDACPTCGSMFYCPPAQKRRLRFAKNCFCSNHCRAIAVKAANSLKPIKTKPTKGEQIRIRKMICRVPGLRGKQMRFDGRTLREPSKTIGLKCEGCGTDFTVGLSTFLHDGTRFCSRRCAWKANPVNFQRYKSGKGGRRADLRNIYFRSRWEANWARYLEWRKARGEIKDWKFEPVTFEFPVKRGSRFYTPDFQVWPLEGEPYYEEVKGYMDKKSATKLNRMRKYHPRIRVDLIDHALYRSAHKQLSGLIPNWESPGSKHAY